MEPLPSTSPNPNENSQAPVSRWVALRRALTGITGLILVVIVAAFILQDSSGLARIRNVATFQSELDWLLTVEGESLRVFTRVDSLDFISERIPVSGDTIIEMGGEKLTPELWRSVFRRILPPDTMIDLTLKGAEGPYATLASLKPEPDKTYTLIVLIDVLRFLIALGFLGVGLWAFFSQPNSSQTRAFAWFCYSMTAAMLAGVQAVADYYSAYTIPFRDAISGALGVQAIGVAAFWVHLQLLFPRPLGFLQRHAKWLLPLVYAPWVGMIVLAMLATFNIVGHEIDDAASWILLPQVVLLLTGFAILGWRHHRAVDRVEKRQLRLVLWGTGLGIGGFVALLLIVNLIRGWFTDDPMRLMLIIVVGFMMLLITPVSFAYAFTRYRLLEVQGKIRRGTRYLIAAVVAFALMFFALYLIGQYTLFGSGISNSPWAMLLVILFALGLGRVSTRLNRVLEQRFFPERKQLRERLEGVIETSPTRCDTCSFWEELGERIRMSLHIQHVQPVLAGENGGQFLLPNREMTPFLVDSDFIVSLGRERKPVLVDELVASGRSLLSDDEHRWLSGNNVALVLPLVTQQRMTGFLALGFKNELEDFAPEELRVLGNFAPQLALASENLRLLEENVEKRRLEEQMQMARRIQEGFLPQELPETIGLELATHSRFSYEVAGDYFDVLTLPDGETVVAIADVSGKGAGAALLMANLQASLRTAVEAGIPLTKAIGQVNNLIFRNTPPEQYITFVAVHFDPRTSQLCYVNAGHNPPLLIRSGGQVEELAATGLILGAIPSVSYEEGRSTLRAGDLLVLYTDGISEAMNDAEEEYGSDRIRDLALQMRTESAARIVAALEDDVERFCGRIPNEDDSTMVVVKRL